MDTSPPEEDALTTLCRSCGLCCDGSLFTHVNLEPEERERLTQMGIPLHTFRSGSVALKQRCAALEGRDCSIYKSRPASCAAYQCVVARELVAGETTLEEAQKTVRKAHRLIAEGHARRFLRRRFRGRKGLED